MIRFALVVAPLSLVAFTACSPRFDVDVAWTVDGQPAADACKALTSPDITLRLEQRDSETGPVVEETQSAKCDAGKATVHSAAFSQLFIDLTENKDVFGAAGPIDLAPGASGGGYAGEEGDAPVLADVALSRGKLHMTFTVVGQDCSTAGASDFTVTVREATSPGADDIVVDGKTVSCGSSGATLDFEPADIGAHYDVVATTTAGGVTYTTSDDGTGDGAFAEGAVTDIAVDLDVVGRP